MAGDAPKRVANGREGQDERAIFVFGTRVGEVSREFRENRTKSDNHRQYREHRKIERQQNRSVNMASGLEHGKLVVQELVRGVSGQGRRE